MGSAREMDNNNEEILQDFARDRPNYKLVYVTPEKIEACPSFRAALVNLYRRKKLESFVLDEAHCLIKWGRTFRESYIALSHLRDNMIFVPWVVVTATATPRTRTSIVNTLQMRNIAWSV